MKKINLLILFSMLLVGCFDSSSPSDDESDTDSSSNIVVKAQIKQATDSISPDVNLLELWLRDVTNNGVNTLVSSIDVVDESSWSIPIDLEFNIEYQVEVNLLKNGELAYKGISTVMLESTSSITTNISLVLTEYSNKKEQSLVKAEIIVPEIIAANRPTNLTLYFSGEPLDDFVFDIKAKNGIFSSTEGIVVLGENGNISISISYTPSTDAVEETITLTTFNDSTNYIYTKNIVVTQEQNSQAIAFDLFTNNLPLIDTSNIVFISESNYSIDVSVTDTETIFDDLIIYWTTDNGSLIVTNKTMVNIDFTGLPQATVKVSIEDGHGGVTEKHFFLNSIEYAIPSRIWGTGTWSESDVWPSK